MNSNNMHISMWKKPEGVCLVAIITLGLMLRLYGVDLPLLDALQIKQTHVAMIARNLFYDGMNVFCTRLDHYGGCFILEFPIMHSITALLYYIFGIHEVVGRMVNVTFSLGAMLVMYGLARQFLSWYSAMGALIIFVISPINIYCGRAYMVEPSMMFFSIAAIYFFLVWRKTNRILLFVISILCTALAGLAKPPAIMVLAPIITAWFVKEKWSLLKDRKFWLYVFFGLTPVIAWAIYAKIVNASNPDIPPNMGGNWLKVINGGGNVFEVWLDLWTNPAFYIKNLKWIFVAILTPIGFVGALIGCFVAPAGSNRKMLYVWLGAFVAFLFIVASANIGHPYYKLYVLPPAAIMFGYAVERYAQKEYLRKLIKNRSLFVLACALSCLVIIGYGIGFYKFYSYMYDTKIRMPYVLEVSEILQNQTPEDAYVLKCQPGATPAAVSYYSKRKTMGKGFYILSDEEGIALLEYERSHGATTYLAIDTVYGSGVEETKKHKMFWRHLNENYKPIALTDHYLIFDLRKP